MSELPNERPFSESDLQSPEYRDRLRRKLNCLIALLEVAMARVRRSLEENDEEAERLERIRCNLENTLDVCLRARTALERSEELPESLPEALSRLTRKRTETRRGPEMLRDVLRPKVQPLPTGAATEMGSSAETKKFERLGRIAPQDVARCDLDELMRRLQGS